MKSHNVRPSETKRSRQSLPELCAERDIEWQTALCQGRSVAWIAQAYKVTRQYVNRRMANLPEPVKDAIRKQVERLREQDALKAGTDDLEVTETGRSRGA